MHKVRNECVNAPRSQECQLFILNANGALRLLAASFGGQGSSKQKGAGKRGPRWLPGEKAAGVYR